MDRMILIYITNPSKKEAKTLVNLLLKKRLIACANIFPVDSLYWWKNKIADEQEWIIIAKTLENKFRKAKAEIEKIHSYSIPCVIKIPARTNEKYFGWLKSEVKEK